MIPQRAESLVLHDRKIDKVDHNVTVFNKILKAKYNLIDETLLGGPRRILSQALSPVKINRLALVENFTQ
ncbi:hypothetical protein D3C81_1783180 [compost metagenome]